MTAHESNFSQKLRQFFSVNTGIPEDSAEGAPLKFLVQRNDERDRTIGMFEPNMTPPLAHGLPPHPFESLNELGAGDYRQAVTHAGIENLRRTIPLPTGRPSSRRPST
jgi:hypothetical protein